MAVADLQEHVVSQIQVAHYQNQNASNKLQQKLLNITGPS